MADNNPISVPREAFKPDEGWVVDGLSSGSFNTIFVPSGITLRDIDKLARRLEEVAGAPAIRSFFARLDYGRLTELARLGIREGVPDNDANLLPERYILLLGMKNRRVALTQAWLRSQGFADCPQTGAFDEATLQVYRIWRERAGAARDAS